MPLGLFADLFKDFDRVLGDLFMAELHAYGFERTSLKLDFCLNFGAEWINNRKNLNSDWNQKVQAC